jgi:hypothetical protein
MQHLQVSQCKGVRTQSIHAALSRYLIARLCKYARQLLNINVQSCDGLWYEATFADVLLAVDVFEDRGADASSTVYLMIGDTLGRQAHHPASICGVMLRPIATDANVIRNARDTFIQPLETMRSPLSQACLGECSGGDLDRDSESRITTSQPSLATPPPRPHLSSAQPTKTHQTSTVFISHIDQSSLMLLRDLFMLGVCIQCWIISSMCSKHFMRVRS